MRMDSSDDAAKFNDIVTELFDGKAEHLNYGYTYWYAIKGFVESIGQFLPNDHLPNDQWYSNIY